MKMAYKWLIVPILTVLFCSVAMAAKAPNQGKQLYVLTDRNITANPSNIKSYNKMADDWEADLVKLLSKRGGYDVKLIQKREEFVPGSNAYLLTAKILQYDPGSTTGRIIFGYGDGACSMALHIELFEVLNKPIFVKDDRETSGLGRKNLTRKLNKNILNDLTRILHQFSNKPSEKA